MHDILPHALEKVVSTNGLVDTYRNNDLVDLSENISSAIIKQAKKQLKSVPELHNLIDDDTDEIIMLTQALTANQIDSESPNPGESTKNADKNASYLQKRNKLKKQRQKQNKKTKKELKLKNEDKNKNKPPQIVIQNKDDDDLEIEYIPEKSSIEPLDPNFAHFAKVVENFKLGSETITNSTDKEKFPSRANSDSSSDEGDNRSTAEKAPVQFLPRGYIPNTKEEEEYDEAEKKPMTHKERKKAHRMTCSQLKYMANRPDLVEMHDGNSIDPMMLLHLKSTRNSVPVPEHWSYKRRYLSTQREHKKGFFELPDYLKATGIQEIREALQSREASKTLKEKMRGKVRPKTGKIDIDYQKLHDAFFKNMTKPYMSSHGEIYFEGREFTVRMMKKKAGVLSDDLRIALGMPIGAQAHKCPPPYLIAQQRFGPPPSYPALKIPGLNSPIPEGCTFGYQIGGWGKPPVTESGKPLYGDVFGIGQDYVNQGANPAINDVKLFGEFGSSDEEDSEEYIDEGSEGTQSLGTDGILTPSSVGMGTPSGLQSTSSIISNIELSKTGYSSDPRGKQLYQILQEKQVSVGNKDLVGTQHIYDVSNLAKNSTPTPSGAESSNSISKDADQSNPNENARSGKKKQRESNKKSASDNKRGRYDDDEDEIKKYKEKKFKF